MPDDPSIAADAISPHGGRLIDRVAPAADRDRLTREAEHLPSLTLHPRELSDLELIAVGGFSPLEGFLGREDYRSVVARGRLASDLPWTIPITLSATREQAARLPASGEVALRDDGGRVVGLLHLAESYAWDRAREAERVFRTTDTAHPAVGYLMNEMGDVLLGGRVTLLVRSQPPFPRHHLDPAGTRARFRERGWRRIVAFQTRNPVHRAHEYIQKCALEICDGMLLHPIVGFTKGDDIPADVRMRCYQALLEGYYPPDRVVLAPLPAAMRYGGPKEAVFHAIVRRNYGCTHFIVGRDHAGVGSYYGTYDAHHIFAEYHPDEIGITPLFFDHTFYCRRCGQMASVKTCPHGRDHHVVLSGTRVRELLRDGQVPPPEFSREEVARILMESTASGQA